MSVCMLCTSCATTSLSSSSRELSDCEQLQLSGHPIYCVPEEDDTSTYVALGVAAAGILMTGVILGLSVSGEFDKHRTIGPHALSNP